MADLARDGGVLATVGRVAVGFYACWPRSPCRWPGGSAWSAAAGCAGRRSGVGARVHGRLPLRLPAGLRAVPRPAAGPRRALRRAGRRRRRGRRGPVAVPAAPGGARRAGCSRSPSTSCSPGGQPPPPGSRGGPAGPGRVLARPRAVPGRDRAASASPSWAAASPVARGRAGAPARVSGWAAGSGDEVRAVADQDRDHLPDHRAAAARRAGAHERAVLLVAVGLAPWCAGSRRRSGPSGSC